MDAGRGHKVRLHRAKITAEIPTHTFSAALVRLLFNSGLSATAQHPGTKGPAGGEALGLIAARVSEGRWWLDRENKGRRLPCHGPGSLAQ